MSPHLLKGFLAQDPVVYVVVELGAFYLLKKVWEGNERDSGYGEVRINASQNGSLFRNTYRICPLRTWSLELIHGVNGQADERSVEGLTALVVTTNTFTIYALGFRG